MGHLLFYDPRLLLNDHILRLGWRISPQSGQRNLQSVYSEDMIIMGCPKSNRTPPHQLPERKTTVGRPTFKPACEMCVRPTSSPKHPLDHHGPQRMTMIVLWIRGDGECGQVLHFSVRSASETNWYQQEGHWKVKPGVPVFHISQQQVQVDSWPPASTTTAKEKAWLPKSEMKSLGIWHKSGHGQQVGYTDMSFSLILLTPFKSRDLFFGLPR